MPVPIPLEDVLRQLEKGSLYYIRTLDPPKRLQREHVVTYLGREPNGELSFNARPFAGTQSFNPRTITKITRLIRHTKLRDDPRHYMNRIWRGDASEGA